MGCRVSFVGVDKHTISATINLVKEEKRMFRVVKVSVLRLMDVRICFMETFRKRLGQLWYSGD